MNYCPCCSGLLLRHVHGSEISWFCRHCWEYMPADTWDNPSSLEEAILDKSLVTIRNREKTTAKTYTKKRQTVTGWIGVQDIPA
ncbi:hypothetical protein I8751_14160 [Nostocaceae cyanobacterium CENA357]|uniref:Uncharacterized protein n=1 Tax=Atlanticothrix silvestris CENA357 TaxID=1725252 RepID=A0A8J7L2U0_9CYAN|nr:hypothetical protein [Atlanticothrix silvestris]MBH8553494.1 hypothetical protein [Atlanticothrix silvestris CENA357]